MQSADATWNAKVIALRPLTLDILCDLRLYARVQDIPISWSPLPTSLGPPNLPERLAEVFHGLRGAAAGRASRNWVMAPLAMLFASYLSSVLRRFTALVARFEAGTLRTNPGRPRPARPANVEAPARKPRVPRRLGWVIDFAGYHAAGFAANLRQMLAGDAEIRALMAASPQAGRILRPLCRMLRIEQGPDLPPSLYPPRPAKPPALALEPSSQALNDPSSQALSLRSPTEGPREASAPISEAGDDHISHAGFATTA